MKITLDVEYGSHGLPILQAEAGARLTAQKHDNVFTIKGNEQGLLFLARSLVSLAKLQASPDHEGYHIHLDDLYALNDDKIEFILAKED